jgi:cytochrome b561
VVAEVSDTARRYTGVAIALHWLIALLAIGQFAGGLYVEGLERGAQKFALIQMHKSFGIMVLLLTLVRLGWRLAHPAPPLPASMTATERSIARFTHWLFYALLIGIPLIGWAMVSASPFADTVQTYIFGVIHWPHLPFFAGVEDRQAVTDGIKEAHELLAFLMIGLVALHVAAALKHHFVNRDDVLARMAPFMARKK